MAFRIAFLILLASFKFQASATTIVSHQPPSAISIRRLTIFQEIQNASPGDCILVDDVSLCNCLISSFASTSNVNVECHPHTHDRTITRQGYATFAIGYDKGNTIDSRTTPGCVADLHWPAGWYAVFWDWKSRCLVDSHGNSMYQITTSKQKPTNINHLCRSHHQLPRYHPSNLLYIPKLTKPPLDQCCRTTSQPNKYLNPYFIDTRAQIQSPLPEPEFELSSLQNPETNYNMETEGEEAENIILERRRRKL